MSRPGYLVSPHPVRRGEHWGPSGGGVNSNEAYTYLPDHPWTFAEVGLYPPDLSDEAEDYGDTALPRGTRRHHQGEWGELPDPLGTSEAAQKLVYEVEVAFDDEVAEWRRRTELQEAKLDQHAAKWALERRETVRQQKIEAGIKWQREQIRVQRMAVGELQYEILQAMKKRVGQYRSGELPMDGQEGQPSVHGHKTIVIKKGGVRLTVKIHRSRRGKVTKLSEAWDHYEYTEKREQT